MQHAYPISEFAFFERIRSEEIAFSKSSKCYVLGSGDTCLRCWCEMIVVMKRHIKSKAWQVHQIEETYGRSTSGFVHEEEDR
jgi:hypothetical protein